MDFELTEEQRMIQEMTRNFAKGQIEPLAAAIDQDERYPEELVAQMAELGLMGIVFPEKYGGSGMDHICYVIAVEEISRACASTGVILSAHVSLCCEPINKNGTEGQLDRFLRPLATGAQLGCFGLTEPGAGSDAVNLKTTAVRDGEGWVINGTKNFITNAPQAGVCTFFTVTDREKSHRGLSAFVVEAGTPGFSVGKIEHKLGITGSGTSELVFENCRLSRENLLGKEGQGFKIALQTLDGGRIGIASQAIGIGRAALEESIEYAKEREQFGRPIASFQAIQWMLADMAVELDAARLLAYRAARLQDKGARFSKEAAMAKLLASEAAMRATTKGIQIHGGYGYTKEYSAERHFRDAKITELYEGTSEIQRIVIANSLIKD